MSVGAIDSLLVFDRRGADNMFVLGKNTRIPYSYNDGERFELILVGEDFDGHKSEARVMVTKSGSGVGGIGGAGRGGSLGATPVDVQSCALAGGICKLTCSPGENSLGSCGDGVCCG